MKVSTDDHVKSMARKLNSSNVMLYRVRDFVNGQTLRSKYFAIFDFHFNYANTVWGQKYNSIKRLPYPPEKGHQNRTI